MTGQFDRCAMLRNLKNPRALLLLVLLLLAALVVVFRYFSVDVPARSHTGTAAADIRKLPEESRRMTTEPAGETKNTTDAPSGKPPGDSLGDSPAGLESDDAWIHEMLRKARAGDSEAIVSVIFGLHNESSPLSDYMRANTSIEEMTELLRSRIAMGDAEALIDAAGLLFARNDMPELQLPGLYAADIEYALREAVRGGDNRATIMLGLLKLQDFKNTGNPRSREEALSLYHRLGESGDPEALAALAYLYSGEERFGVQRDPEKLKHYLEEFVAVADARQASSLASSLLRDTHGTAPDPIEFEMGIRLLAKAGESGDENALNEAAWILATCNGPTPAQFEQAERYIREHLERYTADPASMDTLAAVHARQGDFTSAMTAQLEAIRLLEAQGTSAESPLYQQFYARLDQYQRGQHVRGETSCPQQE